MKETKEMNNLVEICLNTGHVKGDMIKNLNGIGRYRCSSCGTFYNDYLDQSEKNNLNYKSLPR
ncbi:MAG: hypothetical protein AB7V77_00775 [Candidatus Woesearchaeota archaeon]